MRAIRAMFYFLLVVLAGCAARGTEASSSSEPLTLAAWKALPPETKYEIDTFERLKQGEPKLQDQREWDKFARTVVLPAKKREYPQGRQ